ncbi:serine hydrolase [Bradyrhizobium sp. BR 1432]|uniref:serine hydrolase n=1 Tax=Bradyrhizobium sp. BR 1432 TaxID=3447966 RepID=UPI003EE5E3D3
MTIVESYVDQLVQEAMEIWRVPGLAIGVVQLGKTLVLKGYGLRDLGSDERVGVRTRFLLCSLTKSMTAAGVGLLVQEGKLKWETAVHEVLSEFHLHDPVATRATTILDLLCHRWGLPAHDRIWSPGDYSRSQMIRALQCLEPGNSSSGTFQYSNLGYVVAGAVIERVSGRSWEDFTSERLLLPAGFSDFAFSVDGLANSPDHAHPHPVEEEVLYRGHFWPMRATPAGGVVASIKDMCGWLRVLCGWEKLLSLEVREMMMTPHAYVGSAAYPEFGDRYYGLGLRRECYRGARFVSHTGSQPGWCAFMGLLPDEGIAVVILTNRDPHPAPAFLAYSTFDFLLGTKTVDWRSRILGAQEKSPVVKDGDCDVRGGHRGEMPPSSPLSDYVGEYHNPAYGTITISLGGNALNWAWRGLFGTLKYLDADVFRAFEQSIPRYPDGIEMKFVRGEGERVYSIAAPLEPNAPDIQFLK